MPKLAASQIHWLSKLALFDFNIVYRSGRTNKDTDTLSQCPVKPNCTFESESDNNNKDPVVLSYATICDFIKPVLGDTKISSAVKKEVQAISSTLEGRLVRMCPSYMKYQTLLFIPV